MNITNESPDEVNVPIEKVPEGVCYGCGNLTEDCRCEKNNADTDNYEETRDY